MLKRETLEQPHCIAEDRTCGSVRDCDAFWARAPCTAARLSTAAPIMARFFIVPFPPIIRCPLQPSNLNEVRGQRRPSATPRAENASQGAKDRITNRCILAAAELA